MSYHMVCRRRPTAPVALIRQTGLTSVITGTVPFVSYFVPPRTLFYKEIIADLIIRFSATITQFNSNIRNDTVERRLCNTNLNKKKNRKKILATHKPFM